MRAQMKKTGVAPNKLLEKPALTWFEYPYMKAYLDLEGRRQFGHQSPQPLTMEAIILYGERHGFRNDMEFFVRAMGALDDHYMAQASKEIKAAANRAKSKGKSGRSGRGGRR